MVNMAHHGHNRRTRNQLFGLILNAFDPQFDVAFRNTAHTVAEFFNNQLGRIGINALRDSRHDAVFHQRLDNLTLTGGHTVGKFLHGNGFRQDHITHHADLIGTQAFKLGLTAFTPTLATDRCE